jgi:hypothetical protein
MSGREPPAWPLPTRKERVTLQKETVAHAPRPMIENQYDVRHKADGVACEPSLGTDPRPRPVVSRPAASQPA